MTRRCSRCCLTPVADCGATFSRPRDDQAPIAAAVAYTPNVVPIWEGIRDYFAETAAPMDFVLYSNYARQRRALLDGHVDIAWNTNLAWVRTVLRTDGASRALAMRDVDLTFSTVFVIRPGSGLRELADLKRPPALQAVGVEAVTAEILLSLAPRSEPTTD